MTKIQPMKKSIKILLTSTLIVIMITSCATSAEKVESAEGEYKEAKEDLKEANKTYLEDMEEYKKKPKVK